MTDTVLSHVITGLTCVGVAVPTALKLYRKGNGKDSSNDNGNGHYVDKDLCDVTQKGLQSLINEKFAHQDSKLNEGARRMGAIEQTLTDQGKTLTSVANNVAKLVGAHEK